MQNAMTTDYFKLASTVVAITFPMTERPPLLRSSYQSGPEEKQWPMMVKEAYKNRDIGAVLVQEDSEEGRAIVNGTVPKDLTESYLSTLDLSSLKNLANQYKVKVSGRSTTKTIIHGILSAAGEGVRPEDEE